MQNKFQFLEELRRIAQLGLAYTQDPWDRERFDRLLELCAVEYEQLDGPPALQILDRFHQELGQVTPKVGLDAAIFDTSGRLLLARRSDDGLWELPGGWAELGESVEQGIVRELKEETLLDVAVVQVIDVFSRLPGQYPDQPHTSCHILFHCEHTGGQLSTSDENLEVGYFLHQHVSAWHRDHGEMAAKAHAYWLARSQSGPSPNGNSA